MARYRIGTVGYLNSEPLTEHLDRERFEVVADHPRGIARRLAEGDVVLALAPVAAVLSDGDFRMVPEWGIGADGPVASVLLVSESPPEAWTEIVLDGESRTSVTLARILLQDGPLSKQVRPALPVRQLAPGEGVAAARGTVAAVVIGDAARQLPDRLSTRIDLAACWKDWTGNPFVFAVWAGRPDVPQEVIEAVREAGRVGVAAIPSRYSGADRYYLEHNIRYPLDDRAWMGLRRYAALAERAGLIGSADVQLFGPRPSPRVVDGEIDELLLRGAAGQTLPWAAFDVLATKAASSELATAANLRCREAHDRGTAGYVSCASRSWEDMTDEGLAAWIREGVTAVHLEGFDALNISEQVALLRRVRDAGLQSLAPSLCGLLASGTRDGVSIDVRLSVLQTAGLNAVLWDTRVPVAEDVWKAMNAATCSVIAVLSLESSVAEQPWATVVRRVRDAMTIRERPLDLVLRAWLPDGAFTEPDKTTSAEWLRAMSLVRLFTDPSTHLSASPWSQGLDLSQVALCCGADGLGMVGTASVAPPVGCASFSVSVEYAERVLRVAGFEPVPHDLHHTVLGEAVTRFRRVRRPEERAKP
jgi:predicted solute-binding protein